MKFRTLLIGGFAGICLMLVIMSSLSFYMEDKLEERFDQVVNDRYVKVSLGEHIISNTSMIHNSIYLSLLDRNLPLDKKQLDEISSQIDKDYNQLDLLTKIDKGKLLLADSISAYQSYKRHMDMVVFDMPATPESNPRLIESIKDMEAQRKTHNTALSLYIDFQEGVMLESSGHAFASIRTAKVVSLSTLAAVLLISLLIARTVLRRAIDSIHSISSIMESFDAEHHDHLPRIPVVTKDEFNQISNAYNRMAEALEHRAKQENIYLCSLEEENWVKTYLADITGLYQDNRDLAALGQKLLVKLLPLVDGVCAAFYVLDRSKDIPLFERKAAYAADPYKAAITTFKPGEGLVGQCAAEGKPIEITFPHDHMSLAAGFGSVPPSHLLLLPVSYGDEIIAVLELGSFQAFEGKKRVLLMELIHPSMGTMIRNLQYQKHVEKLYAESQTFNEELQVQSEELFQQQEALRSLNERLEEQVRISDANSRYKSEFMANMSHELRTPLNSVLILGQILKENKDGNLNPKQTEYAETIVKSGNQLLALINDILDLSKIEAGELTLSPESFEFTAFMADLERQFRPLVEHKGLRFNLELDPRLQNAALYTDRQRMLQIVQNLLSNALKFTDKGMIAIRAFIQMEEPCVMAIEVRDTGIGIAKEHHGHIFEAFKQVEGNTSRKYGGTGLGLAISQELAGLIGGSITVDSAPGVGSTFTFLLPYEDNGGNGLLQAAVTADTQPDAASMIASPVRILLVDDDMRNIYSLSSALEEYGYTVICAETGAEALELLHDHEIDLILMDIMMPEMDGCEAIRIIRASDRHRELPIVALTAKAMKEDRDLCIGAGADDYISKPVRLDKLMSIIRVWTPERHSS